MMSEFLKEIDARVAEAKAGAAYRGYERVRRAVGAMMDDWSQQGETAASLYWREELEGFLYMFDASPLIIDTLREQCYHLTGIKSYEYRQHHAHAAKDFQWKFERLAALDRSGLFVPEAAPMGGFGFDFGVGRVNIDTLKFYEVLIGLDRAGFLKRFRESSAQRQTALEIGSGWGGFAYQFKSVAPNTTYVCVDLPPTLLFSGTYLLGMFPDAQCLLYGEEGFEEGLRDISRYDFVFVPHYALGKLKDCRTDLAINMVSFQEMTSEQVNGYVRTLKQFGCPQLYSLNRDRSKHNTQLGAVSEVLAAHYKVRTIELLDLQYTQLAPLKKPKTELSALDYRHYAATLS